MLLIQSIVQWLYFAFEIFHRYFSVYEKRLWKNIDMQSSRCNVCEKKKLSCYCCCCLFFTLLSAKLWYLWVYEANNSIPISKTYQWLIFCLFVGFFLNAFIVFLLSIYLPVIDHWKWKRCLKCSAESQTVCGCLCGFHITSNSQCLFHSGCRFFHASFPLVKL